MTDLTSELGALLASLDQAWAARNAPQAAHLRPGRSEDEVRAIQADAGLPLVPDAVTWFGWDDGADNPLLAPALQHIFAPASANRFIGDW